MACAHAKFTGEVGVCLATCGPGAIHLLNGLYDAKLDHQPVVAIVGQQAQLALGGNYQQEIDLPVLFKDVAHEYVHMAMEPAQIRHLVDRAMRIAAVGAHRRPADRPQRPAGGRRGRGARRARTARCTRGIGTATDHRASCPRESDLEHAAEVLNARRARRDARRRRALAARRPRGQRGRRAARRRRRQGAARQGRAPRRPALGDRLDRAARDQAELGSDDGLRHAADGRLELPLLGVPARGGPGARRADRPRRPDARHPLPDGGQPGRRQPPRRCGR